MKNRQWTRIQAAFYAAAALLMFSAIAIAHGKMSYRAALSGGNETPRVTTKATGSAMFTVNAKETEISYMIHVRDIEGVTMAHIHLGKAGKNGPPVAMLEVRAKKGKFSGMLAGGKITGKYLMGDFKGKTVKDLVKEMKAGNTYVNVHTSANPDGEIRGQIKPEK